MQGKFLFAAVSCSLGIVAQAALNPVTTIVATVGDPVSGSMTLASLDTPALSADGRAVFSGFVTAPGPASRSGIFRAGRTEGIQSLVLSGDAVPDANGNVGVVRPILYVNSSGQTAFTLELNGTLGGALDAMGVFRSDNPASLVQIARGAQSAPEDGRFYLFTPELKSINNAGQVAFTGFLRNTAGGNADAFGIFRGDGANVVQIARSAQAAPGGRGVFATFLAPFSGPALNESGQVLFTASISDPGAPLLSGLFVGDGTSVTELAIQGGIVPGANGEFTGFTLINPAFNNRGEAAFYNVLRETALETADNAAIFRVGPASGVEIARKGSFTPGNRGRFLDFNQLVALNGRGEVLFLAAITGASDDSRSGLFIGDGTNVVAVARSNDPAPGGGRFNQFDTENYALNNLGQAAFLATVLPENGFGALTALFFYDPAFGLQQIARRNDNLPGVGQVSNLEFIGGTGSEGLNKSGLNDRGEVAFWAIAGGEAVVALWGSRDIGNNLPPLTTPVQLSTAQGKPLQFSVTNILSAVSDPEGGPVNLFSLTNKSTAGGTVLRNGSQITYTPPFSFQGVDQVSFVASDNVGLTAQGTIEITVTGPNRAPVSTHVRNNIEFQFPAGEQVTLRISDLLSGVSDPDGDTFSVPLLPTATTRGAVITRNGETFTLTPILDSGTDSFSYDVLDSRGASLRMTAQFSVPTGLRAVSFVPSLFIISLTAPPETWAIERAPQPTGPWSKIGDLVIPPDSRRGGINTADFQDTNAPASAAFYRASTTSSGGIKR